jgi:hypothetical protein
MLDADGVTITVGVELAAAPASINDTSCVPTVKVADRDAGLVFASTLYATEVVESVVTLAHVASLEDVVGQAVVTAKVPLPPLAARLREVGLTE